MATCSQVKLPSRKKMRSPAPAASRASDTVRKESGRTTSRPCWAGRWPSVRNPASFLCLLAVSTLVLLLLLQSCLSEQREVMQVGSKSSFGAISPGPSGSEHTVSAAAYPARRTITTDASGRCRWRRQSQAILVPWFPAAMGLKRRVCCGAGRGCRGWIFEFPGSGSLLS